MTSPVWPVNGSNCPIPTSACQTASLKRVTWRRKRQTGSPAASSSVVFSCAKSSWTESNPTESTRSESYDWSVHVKHFNVIEISIGIFESKDESARLATDWAHSAWIWHFKSRVPLLAGGGAAFRITQGEAETSNGEEIRFIDWLMQDQSKTWRWITAVCIPSISRRSSESGGNFRDFPRLVLFVYYRW